MKIISKLKNLLIPSGNIAEKAVSGGVISGATNFATRGLQIIKIIILTHFLGPAAFGILGIGLLTLAVLRALSEVGVKLALVQRPEDNVDSYLDTAWVIAILRGSILTAIAFLIAPYVASFFGEPGATDVIRVIGLVPVIRGFRNPGIIYFTKELEFHKQAAQEVPGTLANFLVAVVAGVILQNVWALVFGTLTGAAVTLVVSYMLHEYRPRWNFDLEIAQDIISYGKWILATSVVSFLLYRGDDSFVGWFLGAGALGIYQISDRFGTAPSSEITSVITNVTFPSYSQVQEDIGKLRDGFLRSLRLSASLSFPAAAGVFLVAPEFVEVFLGPEWGPAVQVIQVLSLSGFLRSIHSGTGALFNATGNPDLNSKVKVAALLFIGALIFPLTSRFGVVGTAIVIVLSGGLISLPVRFYFAKRVTEAKLSELLSVFVHPAIGTFSMIAMITVFRVTFGSVSPLIRFLSIVVIGVVVYASYTMIAIVLFDYKVKDELLLFKGVILG